MFRPDIPKMVPKDENVFSLAIAVARRAKEINNTLEEEKKIFIEDNSGRLPFELNEEDEYLEEKPVTVAMEEIVNKEVTFRSAGSNKNKIY